MNSFFQYVGQYVGASRRLITLPAVSLLLIFSFAALSASAQIYHDPHKKMTVGFSVDLNTPPDTVLQIVKGVANDSIIRGTSMYAKEIDLPDAEFVKSSSVLAPEPGAGQVFYKVRTKVLAPEHFPASSDMGTVTVRYVVETVNPQRAHLAIDAVFVTDAGHRLYASDGSVETAEYAEIIPDLLHVHPGAIRTALRAIPRLYVVTDSTSATGMPDGEYRLGSQHVTKCLGGVRLADGTLAGSTLTMDQALRNLVSIGLPIADVSNRLSRYAADYLGIEDRGRIARGAWADIVVFDRELALTATYVEGESIVEYA